MSRLAVVLFNLGGPDGPEAVRPFLYNLFRDPAIIGAPALVRYPLAAFISATRAKGARANYALMGGGSPLLPETRRQAEALEGELARLRPGQESRVFIAMRYWKPFAGSCCPSTPSSRQPRQAPRSWTGRRSTVARVAAAPSAAIRFPKASRRPMPGRYARSGKTQVAPAASGCCSRPMAFPRRSLQGATPTRPRWRPQPPPFRASCPSSRTGASATRAASGP